MDPMPGGGRSVHPSQYILTAYTNADPTFSAGPPPVDAVITIKKIRAWYDRPPRIANDVCPTKPDYDCTVELSCPVTVF